MTREDEDCYWDKQTAQMAESLNHTSQRIETMLREWEQNQRWQVNQIRQEVKAISKIAALVGMAIIVAVIIYAKQAMNW